MFIFIIILICIIFMGMKIAPENSFHTDYCSPKQTSAVNGIFTVLIFLSHSSQYITLDNTLDKPYLSLQKFLGQIVVAGFLFYSGYGIMESISKKGIDYVKKIPSNRLFKVWYHFAVTILFFILMNIVIGKDFGIKKTLLSFTGVTSIGNSNWYMFITFVMYIIIFISFIICRKSKALGVILVTVLTIAFAYIEYKAGLENRYFNTILCFPAGMLFSLIKPKFDKIIMKSDSVWAIGFVIVFAAFFYLHAKRYEYIAFHNIQSILAVVLIIMITMKLKIGNEILSFFGRHLFSFFILQRLPMITLTSIGYNKHPYSFIILSFICTVVISIIFDYVISKADKLIYSKSKR